MDPGGSHCFLGLIHPGDHRFQPDLFPPHSSGRPISIASDTYIRHIAHMLAGDMQHVETCEVAASNAKGSPNFPSLPPKVSSLK